MYNRIFQKPSEKLEIIIATTVSTLLVVVVAMFLVQPVIPALQGDSEVIEIPAYVNQEDKIIALAFNTPHLVQLSDYRVVSAAHNLPVDLLTEGKNTLTISKARNFGLVIAASSDNREVEIIKDTTPPEQTNAHKRGERLLCFREHSRLVF
jgi:hypothetical protein